MAVRILAVGVVIWNMSKDGRDPGRPLGRERISAGFAKPLIGSALRVKPQSTLSNLNKI